MSDKTLDEPRNSWLKIDPKSPTVPAVDAQILAQCLKDRYGDSIPEKIEGIELDELCISYRARLFLTQKLAANKQAPRPSKSSFSRNCSRAELIDRLPRIDKNHVHFENMEFELTANQIQLLAVLIAQARDFLEDKQRTPDLTLPEIFSKAKVSSNRKQLSDAFKSRKKEYDALIKKSRRGKYSLKLPFECL